MYANFDFRSHGQICIYAKFAYMQIEMHLVSARCKFQEFAYGANFAYPFTMDRFAHVSIFAYKQIFAHVCKSVHVNAPVVFTIRPAMCN